MDFPDDSVKQAAFLKALKDTGVIASACRASGVSYGAATNLRKTSDDFAAAWDDAIEQATDTLETEARRRALEGYDEPVIYQGTMSPRWEHDPLDGSIIMDAYDTGEKDKAGNPIMAHKPRQLVIDGVPQFLSVRKHSDALMMFLLKGNRAKFKDTSKVELTGAGGGPVQMDDTTKGARLATLLALAESRSKEQTNFDDLA